MPSINLKQLKIDEPTRNFDSSVDANTNIPGENDQGLFGGFKFFAGIKTFFKGISALGTLASGSRLPVTDSNGNVTYTTMNDINNYVVNNALANFGNETLGTVTAETNFVVNNYNAKKVGKLCQLNISIKNNNAITKGSSEKVATIMTDSKPLDIISAVGFYSTNLIVCYINRNGEINIRPITDNLTANSSITFSLTWCV